MLYPAELEELRRRLNAGELTLAQERQLAQWLENVPPAPPRIPFTQFVEVANPNYRWWDWNLRLASVLQRVADGLLRRVMVFVGPRYGKTEIVSKLFPAYFQYLFPMRKIGLTAFVEARAEEYLRHAQEYYMLAGGSLRGKRDEGKSRAFETEGRGGMWSAGMGGSLIGLGFHLGIIDDPVKNSAEAASKTIQLRNSNWYTKTWYNRREPNDAQILVMQRWHLKDLAGFILDLERVNKDDPDKLENWHIVVFDEIRDPSDYGFPDNCSLEPDPRPAGALLCPERVPWAEVKKNMAKGDFAHSAQFQQRPKTAEGTRFKGEWFEGPGETKPFIVNECPADVLSRVRYWDLAGTDEPTDEDNDPDWTVGMRVSRGRDGLIYIEHMARFRKKPGARNASMRVVADKDAHQFGDLAVKQWWEGESGVGGDDRNKDIAKALAGHICESERPITSKESRHEVLQSQAQVGNVRLVRPKQGEEDWIPAFLDEMTSVPHGAHDDIADAASGGTSKVLATEDIPVAEPVGTAVVSPWGV